MRAVREVTGLDARLSTGWHLDRRRIAPMGAQVVELGVPNQNIHKVNERVTHRGIPRAGKGLPEARRSCCWWLRIAVGG